MEASSERKKLILSISGALFVLVVVLLILFFFFNGSTTIVDGGIEVENQTSIVCTSEDIAYPLFSIDNSDSKNLKVNAMFDDDKLETIMLTYSLNYSSPSAAEKSRDANHIAMNANFEKDSLPPDYFDAHYSLMGNTAQLILYARGSDLNGITAKYFLLGDTNGSLKKDLVTKTLNNSGLDCVVRQ